MKWWGERDILNGYRRKWTKRKKKVKCLRRAVNCTPLSPLSVDKSPLGAREKRDFFHGGYRRGEILTNRKLLRRSVAAHRDVESGAAVRTA